MLKKIPQDENVKPGDIIFYPNACGFEECPMIVVSYYFIRIVVRYYNISSSEHAITSLPPSYFISIEV